MFTVVGNLRVLQQAQTTEPFPSDSTPNTAAEGSGTTPLPATTDPATAGDNEATPTRAPKPPGKDSNSASRQLIAILLGTLAAMFIVVVILGVVTALAVLWGLKMNRRRRIERDLVLRTKHDIFEGIPNVIASESTDDCPLHVLDSSSPIPDGSSGTFDLAASTRATDIPECSSKTDKDTEK